MACEIQPSMRDIAAQAAPKEYLVETDANISTTKLIGSEMGV
jgi:hypothetical protein